MAGRRLARFLAPLALIAALVGVIAVVALSGPGGSSPSTSATPAARTTPVSKGRTHARAYVVKPGDSLTAIAERTGVSIDVIETLNPDVDPQALHVGERLKLAR